MTAVVKPNCELEVQDAVSPTIIDSFVIAANNFQLYHSTSTVQITSKHVTSLFRFTWLKTSARRETVTGDVTIPQWGTCEIKYL